jgi:hypothetical protein
MSQNKKEDVMSKRSKREVEKIVSGMGVFMAIISTLVELVKKFGGTMESIYRLATPEGLKTLEDVARVIVDATKKNATPPGRFFMTITLGTYSTVADLRQAILSSGKKISDYAGQILKKIEISPEKIEIDLWEVSGAELGFTKTVSRSTIYQRAFELGFEKSPAEGIALSRIKCEDKKWRIGGMEPKADSDGVLSLLDFYSDGHGLRLSWLPVESWLCLGVRSSSAQISTLG